MLADEIRKQMESNQRAIEMADRAMKQIEETLRVTREQRARARAVFRRAGYLR